MTFTKYFHVYKPDQFLVKIKLSFFSMQFLLQVIIITAIIIAIITSIIVIIHSVIKTLIMIISTISVDISILSEILRTTINFIFWGFKVLLVFALLFYYQTTTDSCCVVFYMFSYVISNFNCSNSYNCYCFHFYFYRVLNLFFQYLILPRTIVCSTFLFLLLKRNQKIKMYCLTVFV